MRLHTYLLVLALVCGLGGLLLEFAVFQRQQSLDSSVSTVESATEMQQDVSRLGDNISQLFVSTDLLFGASETYMIGPTSRQLKLGSTLVAKLEASFAESTEAMSQLQKINRRLQTLELEVEHVSAQAREPDFVVAEEQLDRVDETSLALAVDLRQLTRVANALADAARNRQSELRKSFDTISWMAGGLYIGIVCLVFVWTVRSVARPLNKVAEAADVALTEGRSFEAAVEGPVEVQALADHISTLVHSLERAAESRTQFLASMSHELRTPLNGVLGMTAVLLDSDLRPQDRRCMELIQSSGESLYAIINELLDFARYEDGSIELESEPFSLETLVSEVLDVTTPLAHQKGIALYLDMPLLKSDGYLGDKNRLRQVLLNLLSNAIKFTQEGAVNLKIEVGVSTDGAQRLGVRVSDTGIGIPKDKLRSIFSPFSQSDASISRKYGGTGLGLAICAEIIGLMGSRITVKSDVGHGSEFSFSVSLPVHQAETTAPISNLPPEVGLIFFDQEKQSRIERTLRSAAIDTVAYDSIQQANHVKRAPTILVEVTDSNAQAINRFARAHADTTVLAMGYSGQLLEVDEEHVEALQDPACPRELLSALSSEPSQAIETEQSGDVGLRVLVADDNPVNLKVATKMIERLGCRVDHAHNGQEAIDACERNAYDVVFMDVQMPSVDGLAATRTIRSRLSDQPYVIGLTANAMEEDRKACMEAGMDDFLSKPVRMSEVDLVLNRLARTSAGTVIADLQNP